MSLSRTTHTLPGLVVPVDELLSNSARVAEARESKHMRAICVRHGHRARPGRHLEQPDWVAGTQDVSSTETPHPAGDDLRILRQRSHPPTAAITARAEACTTIDQLASPDASKTFRRDDGAARTRLRGRARFHSPGNDAGLSCLYVWGGDATPRHVRGLTGAEHALRAGADVAAKVIECDGTSRGGRSHASRCWGAKGCGAQARHALLTLPMVSA